MRAGGSESTTLHRFWNSLRRAQVSLLAPALLTVAVGLVLSACGSSKTGASSTSTARSLLSQTFSGAHPVDSGVLSAQLAVKTTGSSILTQPLTLSFGGPFQSRGTGKLPESDFTVAIGFQGHTGQLGILSTGTEGFVSLANTAYKLPTANFKQLESGVSAVGGGSSGTSSTLSSLGIHPSDWLADPEVVGSAEVGGTETEHIHGTLALGPLLSDLSKILGKASQVNATAASTIKSITPAEQAKIKGEVRNATFDLYTGSSDHTIRKLTVTATLPITGATSRELGGMTAATISFSLGYSDIGQSETINPPGVSKPYSQFKTAIGSVVQEIEQLVISTSTSATGGTGGTGGTGTIASGGSGPETYSQCVTDAGGSVANIQKCAGLLNG
jgi:hypothetical protein